MTAPVLWLDPEQGTLRTRSGVSDAVHATARGCFARLQVERVADAGHNLHHDQPETVARIIEHFLLSNERS